MKTAKQQAQELLDGLPDDVSMDTLLAELYFKVSMLRGLEDVRQGNVVSHEEVKERLQRWLASSGRIKLSEK